MWIYRKNKNDSCMKIMSVFRIKIIPTQLFVNLAANWAFCQIKLIALLRVTPDIGPPLSIPHSATLSLLAGCNMCNHFFREVKIRMFLELSGWWHLRILRTIVGQLNLVISSHSFQNFH